MSVKKFFNIVFFTFFLTAQINAQPKLKVESDSVEVGQETTVRLLLKDISKKFAYASMTLWLYYDHEHLTLVNSSFENSFIPQFSKPYLTEAYNIKIPEGNYKKINIGFYRAEKITTEGLITELKFFTKKMGNTSLKFSYAEIGSYQIPLEQLIIEPISIVEASLEKIDADTKND